MAKKKKSHRRRGMHGLGKINFAANLKNALTKKEVIDDLTGLWAIVPYLGIATVFGMQGYLEEAGNQPGSFWYCSNTFHNGTIYPVFSG